jgi:hypothetical protein
VVRTERRLSGERFDAQRGGMRSVAAATVASPHPTNPCYLPAALSAQKVCSEYFDGGNSEMFSLELWSEYDEGAEDFFIVGFVPHPCACNACGGD